MSVNQKKELDRYPGFKKLYLKAFERMLNAFDKESTWKTAEDVMKWWIGENDE